uniref:MHC class II transactivator isoform X4 n=1 Tax=Arvicanthis niloticus TaxID=61156 RepID=UPI0014875595|nr:MHC class II transactivator isoform X4 [Arvicanthis niloticus]
MELGSPEGSYLELLNSDVDPLHLYRLYDQMDLAGEEEIELSSEPDTDTINCDQFSKLLQDMEMDEETREAYANIAELDQYVFQDTQLEGLSKDLFKHIGAEEGFGENIEVPVEAGQKPQKRRFPEEHDMDSKHRKLVPPSRTSLNYSDLPAGHIQIFTTLPQGLWQISGPSTGLSSFLIYHGEMPQVNQVLPSSSPTVPSLPESPDRPGSASPFAPSTADLPSMPEPALTCRVNETEDTTSPSPCQEGPESSIEFPKWPGEAPLPCDLTLVLCLGLRPSFHRASLSDTMALWESLQQQGELQLLQTAEKKFTIEPFKAKSPKDVEDLDSLVQTQRLRNPSEDAAKDLPAIRDLKKLEFALGPVLGPQVFPTLAKVLPAFSSLQHLDLDSLSENKIGDKGVSKLSATFPQLKALETLNLSQNSITDVGACKLAEALPALAKSLVRLSLYNNCICDTGAKSLAQVLPDMVSLRVMDVQFNKFTAAGAQQLASSLQKCPQVETLAMWTPTIPFGVQEHLQQLDARISLR